MRRDDRSIRAKLLTLVLGSLFFIAGAMGPIAVTISKQKEAEFERRIHDLPGAKLVAFCQAKTQLVTLEEVLPDQRTVKLVCEGGMRKDEVLPGLRARPEDLPVPK